MTAWQPTQPRRKASIQLWAGLVGVVLASGLAVFLLYRSNQARHEETPPAPGDDPRLTFPTPYRNVRPDVPYASEDACAHCHVDHAESFRKHPMGRSLAPIANLAAQPRYDSSNHNPFLALGGTFEVELRDGHVFHKEVRRDPQGRVFAEVAEEVHYVIGSGMHTCSYLIDRNGHVVESPITFYSQKRIWDLSPGFETRRNLFDRPVTSECLFCHTNQVEPVEGTANRFRAPLFRGSYAIGCQRCHGPGSLHVERRERGDVVEGMDDTIVNPGRLSPELREAVCQQCHLPGAKRILGPGREFFDFRPGLPWELFWSVLVKSQDQDYEEFDSSVEQMYASRCFRESKGKLGCISCHDPHRLPEPEEKVTYYRDRCLQCHDSESSCSLPLATRKQQSKEDDCRFCHMPSFKSTDIPHTLATDHRIPRKAQPPDRPKKAATAAPAHQLPIRHFHRERLDPEDRVATRGLGIALLEQAQNPELNQSLVEISMPLLEEAVQTWPEDLSSWDAKAVGLALLGRPQEALEICEMILTKAPEREVTLLNAALFTKALGRAETAISYWQRILDVNPWSVQHHAELAKLFAQRKEWSKTLAECQRILRQYPASLDARLLLMDYYLHHGDRERARVEFDRALTLNPPNPDWLRRWFDAQLR